MANDDDLIITPVAQWLDRWMKERDVPGSNSGVVISVCRSCLDGQLLTQIIFWGIENCHRDRIGTLKQPQ